MSEKLTQHVDLKGAVAILDVARRLGVSCDLDELLDLIINETTKVLDCDRASLFLYDRKRNELYTKVAHGLGLVYLPIGRGIVGACARERTTINVPDAYTDPRFNPDVDRQSGYRTRNILSCPLIDYDGQLVGVVQAVNKHRGAFRGGDEWLLETLSSQAAVALQRARLIREYAEKQRLKHELGLAREIQQGLLPESAPEITGYQIVGWNHPAEETGGDGYDFIPFGDDRLGVVLADASGHGIAPALIVAQLQAMLRVMFQNTDLAHGEIMDAVNRFLCHDLPGDRFVTAFCGILHPDRHELHYCSAGQGPILHVKPAEDTVEQFVATHCPLGIVPELEMCLAHPMRFAVGDVLILVTDGFFEWANPQGEQFGLDRLNDLALKLAGRSADEILTGIRDQVVTFSEGTAQADDLTAVIIKRIG